MTGLNHGVEHGVAVAGSKLYGHGRAPLLCLSPRERLYTVLSETDLGAHVDSLLVAGVGSQEQSRWHNNFREMEAVLLVLI